MSYTLANPIYQHSGESEKVSPIAMQASINEDLEKRRRQLDSTGESRKIVLAKEVSHMIDEQGSLIHLHEAPFPEAKSKPILETALETSKSLLNSATAATKGAADSVAQAAAGVTGTVAQAASKTADTATSALHTATDTASSALHTASDTAASALHTASDTAASALHTASDTVTSAAIGAKNTAAQASATATEYAIHAKQDATNVLSSAATTAIHTGQDAAAKLTSVTKSAAGFLSSAISGAAHKASELATNVGSKTKELAEGAANKAYEVADNISHFTALVGVLAAEEKERARRINDGDSLSVLNARKVSELIRELGPAFYRQELPNLAYSTKLMEEMERTWRLNSQYSSMGETHAHAEGKLVANSMHNFQHFIPRSQRIRGHIHNIEEKERTRRLNDSDETYAIINALALRDIIQGLGYEFYRQEGKFSKEHQSFATTLLEENERRWRIRSHKLLHAEDSAHLLMDVVATNMTKFSYSTRQAAHAVNDFAKQLGSATLNVASQFGEKSKEFAQETVQRVQTLASDISTFTSLMYVIALEERERSRRLNDGDEFYAITNAWKVSGLIRELDGFYRVGRTSTPVLPYRYLEEIERRWRINNAAKAQKNASELAKIVTANLGKFELAHEYAAELMRAREVAAHSRLNPNARPFVPPAVSAAPLPAKQEPIAPPVRNIASGAQL